MQIHELNNFNGTPGATNFLAIDDGSDTSRISGEALLNPVNSRIDNLTANVLPDSVETILDWANVESASKTLTKNVSGFDYLDLYFKENTSGTERIVYAQRYPRAAFPAQVTIPVIRWGGGTDPKYLFFQDLMIAISGTTLTMSQLRIYTWDGKAADGASIEPGILVDQIRVDGVKISSNTNAELTDLRTAHNGTVYASARAAREADYNALDGDITKIVNVIPVVNPSIEPEVVHSSLYIDGSNQFHSGGSLTVSEYRAKKGFKYNFKSSAYSLAGGLPGVSFKSNNIVSPGETAGTIKYTSSATNVPVDFDDTPSTDGYYFVVAAPGRGTITVFEENYDELVGEHGLKNIMPEKKERLTPLKTVAGRYLDSTATVKSYSAGTVDVYEARKGVKYNFTSLYISAGSPAYQMVALFSNDDVAVNTAGAGLLTVSTTASQVSFEYTPDINGFFYVVRFNGRGFFEVNEYSEDKAIGLASVWPLLDKNVAILGDSIMQNMAFFASMGTNVQTYEYNGVSYSYSELTNINGHLYNSDGNECTVKNSLQTTFDSQSWDRLKELIGAKNIINTSIGGSMINETDIITPYPGNETGNNNLTLCLPNLVRWLKRMTDGGSPKPDCAIIWLGTNNIAGTSGDFDTIMGLPWTTLSDDANGRAYRRTTYGGLRYAIESLYREYPDVTIIVFSPIQSSTTGRTYEAMENRAAEIKKMAERYSCIFVDTLHTIGIVDFNNPTSGGIWLRDGLHPNDYGKELYANFASSRLNQLYFPKPITI